MRVLLPLLVVVIIIVLVLLVLLLLFLLFLLLLLLLLLVLVVVVVVAVVATQLIFAFLCTPKKRQIGGVFAFFDTREANNALNIDVFCPKSTSKSILSF